MKSRYFYHISIATPLGFGTIFHNDTRHPLHPDMYKERTEKLASELTIRSGTRISPDMVTFVSMTEIPEEVAKIRWPDDFKS